MASEKQVRNAFEETAPPSTSAPKKLPYDVFINHRGPDTKHTIASSIYNTLHGKGLRVFLDEKELDLGDSVTAEIQEAMRTSFLHIAILSPTYGRSPWCLDELSFMLGTERTIIPVFYNVEPSDVRYAKGVFADAFAEYERKKRYSPEKLHEWRSALQRVSLLNGQICKGNEDDGRLLKSIVNCVLKHMKKELQFVVAKHPVGLEEETNDFESILDSSEKIQIVGIVGMGGCGKTTLAKEIYNRKSSFIEKSSFLFEIRDAASKKELYKKQKKLLQDIGDDTIQFDNVEEGKAILKRCSRFLKVLIILDDVDNLEQLNALLPRIDNFEQGSIIIITSREQGVLKSWGISSIYQMKGLNIDHARELLCWHAFLNPFPLNEFEDLVEKFIQICNGLPLSLEIFGGLLYQKSKEYWESQLNKASRLLPSDIKGRLKISFDALDEEEKEVFLDIACFFIGEEKSLAISVWDGSGWSGLHSLEVIENKCLVDVDEYNQIRMHDQLRDLGKEIAKGWSPFRVWSSQQIMDIQKQNTEGVLIRGIKATTDDFYEECSFYHGTPYEECMELLKCCSTKSKALSPAIHVVKGNYFKEELATLFPALIWLRWSEMPGIALPSWLMLKSLRVLELPHSYYLEELWNDTADPPLELRELNLTDAQNFLRFPRSIKWLDLLKKISFTCNSTESPPIESLPEEFCQLKSLEYLRLSSCGELTSLPSNFGNLTNLRHLDLTFCFKLTSLPGNFGNLSSLRHLQLSYCTSLRVLPDSFKQLRNLQHISFYNCKELTLTSENKCILENVTKLESVDFSGCEKLQKLPQHVTNQLSLRHLKMTETGLRELPINIGELSKLEELSIGSHFLTSLPTSIVNLSSLTSLSISSCRELATLPEAIGNLSSLTRFSLFRCKKFKFLPESVGTLSSLRALTIWGCDRLTVLPESMGHLSSLSNLFITGCDELKTIPECGNHLSSLKSVHVSYCAKLGSLLVPVSSLNQLKEPSIKSPVEKLGELESMYIRSCPITELALLSGSFSSKFCNLKKIELYSTLVSRISISQQCCPSLESILLDSNEQLVEIETLPISVEDMKLSSCRMLKGINVLSELGELESLYIRSCPITELALLSGSFSSKFCNLKKIELYSILVSRISISQQCCPSLESLLLDSNEQLLEIETLPLSVKDIQLRKCIKLQNMDVLSSIVNLERLSIENCGWEFDDFPSLVSPKEFEIIEIADQPMENCRSLEKVRALSCRYMTAINIEHMEGLHRLSFSAACNISALEPCLQTIKKWPSECIICARTERGVESLMEPFAFPNLTLIDSCVEKINEEEGIGELSLKVGPTDCSHKAAMMCFSTNSTSASTLVDFGFHSLKVSEGKWVCFGVLTQPSIATVAYALSVIEDSGRSKCMELGRGMLVMGEQEKVLEAFKQIVVTLGGVKRLKRKAHSMANKKFLLFLRNAKRRKRKPRFMTN